ncbi:muscarinic acetylcholine receptor M4-like [Pomacea canaliculata]|uniref:muscarinic acetylcholine receptor M4-like n=1 Tax=Pomacea canaliculata TaxID=400727 RepID=UPI000D72C6FE|nr:muscarinic acetylcholine receptor M4-like [Pomacea canaliculata]XP_025087064.1 muscarinic acetylcholine receptor M4-like [Pomacea canaliculata]
MVTGGAISPSKNLTSVQMEEYLTRLNREKMVELSPCVVFLAVLIFLGVPGNTLIFFIFWRYFKSSSTRVFVLSMALTDLLTSVLSCPVYILEIHFLYTTAFPHACKMMFTIQRLPVMTSGWILVAVALDRRRRICQPFKRQLNPRQAFYLVMTSLTLASAATFPFLPLRTSTKVKTARDDVFGKRCDLDELSDPAYRTAETIILILSLVFGCLILVSSYVHIGYQLYRQGSRKRITLHTERQFQMRDVKNQHSEIFSTKLSENNEEFAGISENESEVSISGNEDAITSSRQDLVSRTSSASFRTLKIAATSESVETTVRSSIMDTALSSPTVETTIESPTLEITADDGSTTVVSVGNSGVNTSRPPEGRPVGKMIKPRTTLMMFVITVTAIVVFLPYIVISNLSDGDWEYCLEMTRWRMNMCITAFLFVNINSIVNPFVYSFCNPTFRLKCYLFFTSARRRFELW